MNNLSANPFYAVSHEICRLLIREQDLSKLLQGICDQMLTHEAVSSALLILIDQDQGGMVAAESGLAHRLDTIVEGMQKGGMPQCESMAFATDQPSVMVCGAELCSTCMIEKKVLFSNICMSLKCSSSLQGFLALHGGEGLELDR